MNLVMNNFPFKRLLDSLFRSARHKNMAVPGASSLVLDAEIL